MRFRRLQLFAGKQQQNTNQLHVPAVDYWHTVHSKLSCEIKFQQKSIFTLAHIIIANVRHISLAEK